MSNITQEVLKTLVEYDPETGIFYHKASPNKPTKRKAGDVLGYLDGRGYIHFQLMDKKYKAHRLAWLYMYGNWPVNLIDHINGDKTDNRISNLRDVTSKQNGQNVRKVRSLSGYKGVYPDRLKDGTISQWAAQYNKKHLGYYSTAAEAAMAYDEYVSSMFGSNAALNKDLVGTHEKEKRD